MLLSGSSQLTFWDNYGFMDVIAARKSVRGYADKPVEEESSLKFLRRQGWLLHGRINNAADTWL